MPYSPTTWQQRNAKDYFELIDKSTGLSDGNEYLFNYTSTSDLVLSGTSFSTTNMNKIETALNNRQIETGYLLTHIGLTDGDFAGLTQLQSIDLIYSAMASYNYKEIKIPVTSTNTPNLRTYLAPNNEDSNFDGILTVYRTQELCEFIYSRRSQISIVDTDVSARSTVSWISSYDNRATGSLKWSGWKQSGGIRIHYATVSPGGSVVYNDITTANSITVRFRLSTDQDVNRASLTIPRGRNNTNYSVIFGNGGNYRGIARVDFTTGTLTCSDATDTGVIIDSFMTI